MFTTHNHDAMLAIESLWPFDSGQELTRIHAFGAPKKDAVRICLLNGQELRRPLIYIKSIY